MWSDEQKAEYNANIIRSRQKLKATNERNAGIVSQGYGIGAGRLTLSESDVEFGELYDSYDEKGRPTKKIKKPGSFTRLTEAQKADYEERKRTSEQELKESKMRAKQIANPLFLKRPLPIHVASQSFRQPAISRASSARTNPSRLPARSRIMRAY